MKNQQRAKFSIQLKGVLEVGALKSAGFENHDDKPNAQNRRNAVTDKP